MCIRDSACGVGDLISGQVRFNGGRIDHADVDEEHAASKAFKMSSNEVRFDTLGIEGRKYGDGRWCSHGSAAESQCGEGGRRIGDGAFDGQSLG